MKKFKVKNLEEKCNKYSPSLVGLLQASIVFSYILLVSFFMIKGQNVLSSANSITGPVVMLLLLVMSAIFVSLTIFSYPAYLCSKNEVGKGIKVIAYSFLWLLIIFSLFLTCLAMGIGTTSGF